MPQLAISSPPTTPCADVASLYATHSGRLKRLVSLDIHASDQVIDEACQRAWHQLVTHSEQVRSDTALPWLVRIAVNTALKELNRSRREIPLEALTQLGEEGRLSQARSDPSRVAEARIELESVSGLPQRQQRMLWLLALGHTYAEIAASENCTVRTVERQLIRAKRRLRPPP